MLQKIIIFFNLIAISYLLGSIRIRPLCYVTRLRLTAGRLRVGEEFTLTLSVKATDTLPNTRIEMIILRG